MVWLVFLFEFFRCCFQLVFDIQYHSDAFQPFVADRRATARTTETLSHAAISQKNAGWTPCSYGFRKHGCLLSWMLSGQKMSAKGARGHQGAVACTGSSASSLKSKQIDKEGKSPILNAQVNVDWLTLDTRIFSHFFPQLYSGILYDLFTQKALSSGRQPPSSGQRGSR